jgi:hypothetical protein
MFKFPDGMHYGKNNPLGTGALSHGSTFWIVAGVFTLASLLGADIIWTVLEEGITLIFEFFAERLERFFQKSFGLDLYHAQMATAYTGSIILLSAGLMLLRKLVMVARHVREDGSVRWRRYHAWLIATWHDRVALAMRWWSTLDLLNKSAVLIGLVVMVIPMAMLISYGLGMAVAEIL